MMMSLSFCKNTLHAFLGTSPPYEHHRPRPPSPSPSAGLISIASDTKKPTNILESASIKPSCKNDVEDSGSVGSLDEISTSGYMGSCTESLGLESSEQMEETIHGESADSKPKVKARMRYREEAKQLPPPLSSLKGNGTTFLKPVRENGRLILTQVTINRTEVFHASRQDGRLRLQFTKQEKSKQEEEEDKSKQEEKKTDAATSMTRCHELMNHHYHYHHQRNHHHHHHLQQQLWSQQCVTSR